MSIQSDFLGAGCDGPKKKNTAQKPRCELELKMGHVDLGPQPVFD